MALRSIMAAVWMAAALSLISGAAAAQKVNSIPSCYAPLKLNAPSETPALELFVVVDQTVILDRNLRASLLQNALRLVRPGSAVTVMHFSAYSQGRYMDVVASGQLEATPSPAMRNATGVRTLAQLDRCLARQADYGRRLATAAIGKSLDQASSSLARSDILASLTAASRVVAQSSAREKVVLVASDMLENSSIASFYDHNRVRLIDPAAELGRASRANLLGNFGGARVYVLGAGLMGDHGTASGSGAGSYRDPARLSALQAFWAEYFARSRGQLVEFGAPALLRPVR